MRNMIKSYLGLPQAVYVIFLARIINAMGSMVGTLMTFILINKIHFTNTQAGIYLTCVALVLAFVPIAGGKFADNFGKKKMLVLFNTLGLTSYYICSFLQPGMLMLTFMFLASFFYTLVAPCQDALLADWSNSQNRKQVYSLSYMGFNLGFAVGPVLAGLLYYSHLPLVFIINASTTLIS